MELNTCERLVLLQILPRTGDITTLRIINELQKDLGFTDEEHTALNMKTENGSIVWNAAADHLQDIKIGSTAHSILKNRLVELSDRKELQLEYLSLYEKFVESASKPGPFLTPAPPKEMHPEEFSARGPIAEEARPRIVPMLPRDDEPTGMHPEELSARGPDASA